MRSNFPNCLANTLTEEGLYSDNPKDPGGATYKGVTQRTYDGYRKAHGLPLRDVREMSEAELQQIYMTYWRSDALPAGVDQMQLDGSVNSGVKPGVKWIQRALKVTADGDVGPQTIAAARAANPIDVIERAASYRLGFLHGLRTWGAFGKGWAARVARIEAEATAMASAEMAPQVHAVQAQRATEAANSAADKAKAIVALGAAVGAVSTQVSVQPWEIVAGVAAFALVAIILLGQRRAQLARAEAHTAKVPANG